MVRSVSVIAVLGCVVLAGCGFDPYAKGPTNADILESTGLTEQRAQAILLQNVLAVSPSPAQSYPHIVIGQLACRTNSGGMSEGPPWKIDMRSTIDDLSQQQVDAARTRFEALEGYDRSDEDISQQAPAGTLYRAVREDDRGFSVVFAAYEQDRTLGVEVRSFSPCAAREHSDEAAMDWLEASARAVTDIQVTGYGDGTETTITSQSCGTQALEHELTQQFPQGPAMVTAFEDFRLTSPGRAVDADDRTEAVATVTVRYEQPADGLDANRSKRYTVRYRGGDVIGRSDVAEAMTWRLCSFDPA
ncbi:hypothetical protein ACWIGI_34700 [Nocardia sp. NPDC055321]